MMPDMSILRALSVLASQKPTKPAAKLVDRKLVVRRRHRGVPVTWINPEAAARRGTIIHLHGGAYLNGETQNHWAWLEEMRRRTGVAGAMVHYRMPPRFPFPAAYEDAVAAVRGMLKDSSVNPDRWVLSGDSAGAGLAIAVARALEELHLPGPRLLLLTSPWLDLSAPQRLPQHLREATELYTGPVPADDPRISPLTGDLTNLPAIHLTAGGEDDLIGDGRALVEKVRAVGGRISVHEEPAAGHDFPFHGGVLAQKAMRAQMSAVVSALGLRRR